MVNILSKLRIIVSLLWAKFILVKQKIMFPKDI